MSNWLDQFNPFASGIAVSIPLFLLMLAITAAAVVTRLLFPPKPPSIVKLTAYAFLFAVLGAYVGYGTGASREPVVGAVVPALLTLLGAALAYLFNRDQKASSLWETLSVPSLAAFLLSCVVATVIGGQARRNIETVANTQALCESYYTEFVVPACLDAFKQRTTDDSKVGEFGRELGDLCRKILVGGNPCTPIVKATSTSAN